MIAATRGPGERGLRSTGVIRVLDGLVTAVGHKDVRCCAGSSAVSDRGPEPPSALLRHASVPQQLPPADEPSAQAGHPRPHNDPG